jgi:hypothetical protein
MMSWLLSIIVALISGLVSLFLAGFIANQCVSWFNISSREGASGYFVVLVALCGGVVGLVLGLVTARIMASNFGSGFGKELLGALATVVLISGLATLICRLMADIPPTIDGQALNLQVEFRFPDTADSQVAPTSEGTWRFYLASLSRNTERKSCEGIIQTAQARYENRRWIVPTQVELFTQRGSRSVALWRADSTDVIGFILPLPANPGVVFEQWSDWIPREQAGGKPWPSNMMSCRFRVQKIPGHGASESP